MALRNVDMVINCASSRGHYLSVIQYESQRWSPSEFEWTTFLLHMPTGEDVTFMTEYSHCLYWYVTEKCVCKLHYI